MRYYMVDPDNEERLLKIPPHVRKKIREDVLDEVWFAIGELPFFELPTAAYADYAREQALAVIDSLKRK